MLFPESLIDFFKTHNLYNENIFNYLGNITTQIDYNIEKEKIFIGCYYKLNKANILSNLKIIIPKIINNETMIINIHELIHAIILYNHLDKAYYPDITKETLPTFYEYLYIMEHPSKELLNYSQYLDKNIKELNIPEYIFALSVRDKLYQNYHSNFNDMLTLTKKLSHEYKRCKHL